MTSLPTEYLDPQAPPDVVVTDRARPPIFVSPGLSGPLANAGVGGERPESNRGCPPPGGCAGHSAPRQS